MAFTQTDRNLQSLADVNITRRPNQVTAICEKQTESYKKKIENGYVVGSADIVAASANQ